MSNVVNLNRFRKKKAREAQKKQAESSRRVHGRTKAERASEAARKRLLDKQTDGARLVPETATVQPGDDAQRDTEESR